MLGLLCPPAHRSHPTPLALTLCQVSSPAGGWEGALSVLDCGFTCICVFLEAARLLTVFLASRPSWAWWFLGPVCGEVVHLLGLPAGCAECWPWLSLSPCPQPVSLVLSVAPCLSRQSLLLLSLCLHCKSLFTACCFLNLLFRSLFVLLFLLGVHFFLSDQCGN